jgi:predicted amidohydrolase
MSFGQQDVIILGKWKGPSMNILVFQTSRYGSVKEADEAVNELWELSGHTIHVDLIVLPEHFCLTPQGQQNQYEEAMKCLSDLAKRSHAYVVGGTVCEPTKDGIYNTMYVMDRGGEVIGSYRKIHLMKALGADETSLFIPGEQIVCVDTDQGRLGLMVCYDLRFPEIARALVSAGADVLVVGAQFPLGNPKPSRKTHWDLLCQSTALQNSTYVVAANQSWEKDEGAFGRSCVVDPWGKVLTKAVNQGAEFLEAQLNFTWQETIRQDLRLLENRRPDVYAKPVKVMGKEKL